MALGSLLPLPRRHRPNFLLPQQGGEGETWDIVVILGIGQNDRTLKGLVGNWVMPSGFTVSPPGVPPILPAVDAFRLCLGRGNCGCRVA